jgi:F-type H+-transporting ATPase subunit a
VSNLSELLAEELKSNTVFTIPIFGGLPVEESCVVTWIIMAVIALICFLATRNLKVTNISKRQAAVELVVTKLESLVGGMAGEGGEAYVPYLITVLLYLALANIAGVFGFKPPTQSLNVTGALAIMSIILVQAAGIRAKGVKGWLKAFTSPVGIVTPFNILDLVTRPLSLCMRLYGNVLGAFVIMKILEAVVPVIIPAIFSLYFDFFDGILQAYVFVFLTGMYIKEAVE